MRAASSAPRSDASCVCVVSEGGGVPPVLALEPGVGVRRGVGTRRGVPPLVAGRGGSALSVGKVRSSDETDDWGGEAAPEEEEDVEAKGAMGEPRDFERKRGGLR
jgi:hypothetical protein